MPPLDEHPQPIGAGERCDAGSRQPQDRLDTRPLSDCHERTGRDHIRPPAIA
jgi:hypothetical protein